MRITGGALAGAQLRTREGAGERMPVEVAATTFEDLFRSRYEPMVRVAFLLVGSRAEAEDVVQDAFVQAFLKLRSFERQSTFYTWLYRIAFNTAVSRRRKRRVEGSVEQVRAAVGDEPVDRRERPEEQVLRVLGRIGTPDAMLALRRVAQGEVRRFGKRIRLQAIESLGTVGPPGAQILRSLAGDTDSEIGTAAARALQASTA